MPRAWRFVLLLILATPAAAAAQAAPAGWTWTVTPYLLSPHMNGSVGVGSVDAEVDASPSDIFDNLQFGAMATIEARSPTWAVAFDGIYMDLGKDVESSGRQLMLYFHPWELDPDQPRMRGSRLARFRHYVNLDEVESRLRNLMSEFRFGSVREAVPAVAAL